MLAGGWASLFGAPLISSLCVKRDQGVNNYITILPLFILHGHIYDVLYPVSTVLGVLHWLIHWLAKMQKNLDKTIEKIKNRGQPVKVADIDIALRMLKTYMDAQDINPLLSALETLKTDTQNEAYQAQVINAFNDLGNLQGAALTYAPYLNIFVSDDPFGDY